MKNKKIEQPKSWTRLDNHGLQNRFPKGTREKWLWWYECLECGQNTWDALHHIISPTSEYYVKGNHNRSVLNSCPICNNKCHIGHEDKLHAEIPELLGKSKRALESLHYQLKPIDKEFMRIYSHVYAKDKNKDSGLCSCGCVH